MTDFALLKELYASRSKHSNYQVLPEKLAKHLDDEDFSVISRCERERFGFILEHVKIQGASILDIGGNSGYFTFECMAHHASNVHYFEGNGEHAAFTKLASKVLGYEDKIITTNEYYDFGAVENNNYDVILLLNVVHHLGDDYGDKELSMENAKKQMMKQLNSLSKKTSVLVFQMGFCWKGNTDYCLFKDGTKSEMIDFVTDSVSAYWNIEHIGIPEKENGCVAYHAVDNNNIIRCDVLGEFLNRPIFILRSIC